MKFRNDDVHQMFIYPCVIGSLGVVLGLIALFFLKSKAEFIQQSMQFFHAILYWIIWALGKRFKDKMVYFIPIQYLIIQLTIMATSEAIRIPFGDKEVPVTGMLSKICNGFAVYTLLLAPTIWHVLLIYTPCFILSIIFFINRHSEFEELFIGVAFYMILVLITFWYIFQKRELKRFYQQEEASQVAKKAVAKEVEVTNVLNL